MDFYLFGSILNGIFFFVILFVILIYFIFLFFYLFYHISAKILLSFKVHVIDTCPVRRVRYLSHRFSFPLMTILALVFIYFNWLFLHCSIKLYHKRTIFLAFCSGPKISLFLYINDIQLYDVILHSPHISQLSCFCLCRRFLLESSFIHLTKMISILQDSCQIGQFPSNLYQCLFYSTEPH